MEILLISRVEDGNLIQARKQKQAAVFQLQSSFKNNNKYIICLRLQILFGRKKTQTGLSQFSTFSHSPEFFKKNPLLLEIWLTKNWDCHNFKVKVNAKIAPWQFVHLVWNLHIGQSLRPGWGVGGNLFSFSDPFPRGKCLACSTALVTVILALEVLPDTTFKVHFKWVNRS